MRDPMRKSKVHESLLALLDGGEYITPKIVASRSGYSSTAQISSCLNAFEESGMIRRIHHSWHNVQIVKGTGWGA